VKAGSVAALVAVSAPRSSARSPPRGRKERIVIGENRGLWTDETSRARSRVKRSPRRRSRLDRAPLSCRLGVRTLAPCPTNPDPHPPLRIGDYAKIYALWKDAGEGVGLGESDSRPRSGAT